MTEDTTGNSDNARSRRKVIKTAGGLAGGMAASMAVGSTVAQAQSAPTTSSTARTPALVDPTSKYPAPPFKRQEQPWPGLASKMEPPPDHGEDSYRGSNRLAGRRALITGGDSGMGRAAAIAFAREGAEVAINYLPAEEEDAREVILLITQAGRRGVAVPGDIRTEDVCRKIVEDTVRQLGGLDILVLNAARQQTRPSIMDVSNDDFDATMKTNVYAPFWTIKAAMPHLRPGSVIIGTSSIQAREPSAELYDYAQTKATISNWTISLAKQLGPKGIRVNAVAPGPIWTPLQISGGATQERIEQFGQHTTLGRPGQPAELASIYVQLAAADASFANGQIYEATASMKAA